MLLLRSRFHVFLWYLIEVFYSRNCVLCQLLPPVFCFYIILSREFLFMYETNLLRIW